VVYPNPTRGELRISPLPLRDFPQRGKESECTVDGELRVESVEVFDVMGNLTPVPSPNWRGVSEGRGEVNISHLPPGIYFIRITTENGIVTRKVVKE
jgi:hypothetical protein